MTPKTVIKSALQATRLFPVARQAYRRLSPMIRRQRQQEVAFYRRLLAPDALCFDVGANLGQRTDTLLAAGARVICIEPNPACWPDLDFQFIRNRRVKMERVAVGERDRVAVLNTNGSGAAASLLPSWNKEIFGSQHETTAVQVPMTTLDALVRKHGVPYYIKMDIEGYEHQAIMGLSSRVPILSFEFFHRRSEATRACLSELVRLGRMRIRYCDMNCNWFGDPTSDVDEAVADIGARSLDGDMFVWID